MHPPRARRASLRPPVATTPHELHAEARRCAEPSAIVVSSTSLSPRDSRGVRSALERASRLRRHSVTTRLPTRLSRCGQNDPACITPSPAPKSGPAQGPARLKTALVQTALVQPVPPGAVSRTTAQPRGGAFEPEREVNVRRSVAQRTPEAASNDASLRRGGFRSTVRRRIPERKARHLLTSTHAFDPRCNDEGIAA